ncbi:DUF6398 domain-containing protein [Clostridium sp. CMCC3677]|uniref:DUF6398 domain-containing protein n=1 Tax=Clostridium sp. CMCC3677 TaxID=2949963 RepID=UPI0013F04A8B|nr:DUF6398 domain-containing protein [Clostridium sp. CMCC3677]NFG61548.1 hypothetical protein [Clostridium botulinum]NFQ10657.1 hypothetical protein [Clostridium botulinum]
MQNLPNSIVEKYEEILGKIKVFSNQYLNEQYEKVCIKALHDLGMSHEDSLKKGKSSSWAAGVVHAIGTVNNLFDVKEEPYIKALDLYKEFGVSNSTGSMKSKEIRNLLNISKDDEIWIVNSNDKSDSLNDKKEVEAEKEENIRITEEFIKAQKIMRKAWSEKNFNKKVKLAKEALSVCEYCSDAYIILSKDVSLTHNDKKELLEKAVDSGKYILGIDSLKTASKECFNKKEAQPFFGAKYTLAIQLWKMGKKNDAIDNAFEILEFNEKDNLMVRGILSSWLLIEKRYDDAEKLFKKYDNDYLAAVSYNKALLRYKTGKIKEAEDAIRKAYKKNSFVIPYILKQKKIPKVLPRISRFGSDAEAMHYIKYSLEAWNESKETINWIKEMNINFKIQKSN